MTIKSPKTEHHAGHESRVVPLFPDVERELLSLHLEAAEGEDRVFPTIDPSTNLRTTFEKIIRRAGVQQWPKLWQNLRASAATDLARAFPSHIATAICGHSEEVAMEHYWTVTDSDFSEAIKSTKIGGLIGGLKSRQVGATRGDSTESASPAKDPINQGKQGKKEPQATHGSLGQIEVSGRGGLRNTHVSLSGYAFFHPNCHSLSQRLSHANVRNPALGECLKFKIRASDLSHRDPSGDHSLAC